MFFFRLYYLIWLLLLHPCCCIAVSSLYYNQVNHAFFIYYLLMDISRVTMSWLSVNMLLCTMAAVLINYCFLGWAVWWVGFVAHWYSEASRWRWWWLNQPANAGDGRWEFDPVSWEDPLRWGMGATHPSLSVELMDRGSCRVMSPWWLKEFDMHWAQLASTASAQGNSILILFWEPPHEVFFSSSIVPAQNVGTS